MAKQATSFGFESDDTWAFGPGTKPVAGESVPAVEASPAAEPAALEGIPASGDYGQPAVFLSEPSEPPASERDMWDQLPPERSRHDRGRRYVGKHRA